jgi:hypothetical protein
MVRGRLRAGSCQLGVGKDSRRPYPCPGTAKRPGRVDLGASTLRLVLVLRSPMGTVGLYGAALPALAWDVSPVRSIWQFPTSLIRAE